MTQAVRIANELREVVEAGDFYPRTYDRDTRAMSVAATPVAPTAVIVNEQTSQHGAPRRNRQDFRYERRSWRWRVVARFDQEVSADQFEAALLASPPRLARDPAEGLEQVHLRLVSVDYLHPVQQSAPSGSQVIFSFEADLSPA